MSTIKFAQKLIKLSETDNILELKGIPRGDIHIHEKTFAIKKISGADTHSIRTTFLDMHPDRVGDGFVSVELYKDVRFMRHNIDTDMQLPSIGIGYSGNNVRMSTGERYKTMDRILRSTHQRITYGHDNAHVKVRSFGKDGIAGSTAKENAALEISDTMYLSILTNSPFTLKLELEGLEYIECPLLRSESSLMILERVLPKMEEIISKEDVLALHQLVLDSK